MSAQWAKSSTHPSLLQGRSRKNPYNWSSITRYNMVLILDDNSEIGAHVRDISVIWLLDREQSQIVFVPPKRPIFLHAFAICPELPFNIGRYMIINFVLSRSMQYMSNEIKFPNGKKVLGKNLWKPCHFFFFMSYLLDPRFLIQ